MKKSTPLNQSALFETKIRYLEEKRSESAYKPGSVEDNHSSRFCVTTKFKQPTLAQSGLT